MLGISVVFVLFKYQLFLEQKVWHPLLNLALPLPLYMFMVGIWERLSVSQNVNEFI